MTTCLSCGKNTRNPKFCNRSCAAKHNNVHTPKRRPEGKCQDCGTPINTSRKQCEACKEAALKEAERRRLNIREWTTLSGETREASILSASTRQTLVYKTSVYGRRQRLTDAHPIGDLLEQVFAVCFNPPPYLDPRDAGRHITMIDHLRDYLLNFNASRHGVTFKGLFNGLDTPIAQLGRICHFWIQDFLYGENPVTFASFAISTAKFIVDLAYGPRFGLEFGFGRKSWTVQPLVDGDGDRQNLALFDDNSFKRALTDGLQTIGVIAEIPQHVVMSARNGEFRLEGGVRCLFRIKRSHLSQGLSGETRTFSFTEEEREHDICKDFRFLAIPFVFRAEEADTTLFAPEPDFLTEKADPKIVNLWEQAHFNRVDVMLPGRWITHEIFYDETSQGYRATPLPFHR